MVRRSVTKKRLLYMINHSRDFVTLIRRDYTYEFANDAYCTSIDRKRETIEGRTVAAVWGDERFAKYIRANLDRCFSGETVEVVDRFTFGRVERDMHVVYYPYDEDGTGISHALVFSHDISRISEIENKLNNYEYLDPLTGLFNRRSLRVVLDREVVRLQRGASEKPGSLLFVMLKNFKQVNQMHGHHIGDLLLENTGLRAKQAVRTSDYVFRFEGTNLVVLLPELSRDTDAAIVAQKIHDEITMPYRFMEIDITIDCHVGVAVFPDDGTDVDTLIHASNSAVVEAEKQKLPFLLYDESLHSRAVERVTMKTGLQRAFERNELELYFQAIVHVDGTIAGAEALIRWNHPTRGLLEPASFLQMAEETGLISPIDKLALFTVCATLVRWSHYPDIFVTINISAADLLREHLPGTVERALQDAGSPDPQRLKLELTETKSVRTASVGMDALSALAAIGTDIWIDDFGTGESSLSALSRYPARTVKIDKEFVKDLTRHNSGVEYLSGIVSSIRSLGKEVVLEGISDAEQRAIVSSLDVSYHQGYYYSDPMPTTEFEALLELGGPLPIPSD